MTWTTAARQARQSVILAHLRTQNARPWPETARRRIALYQQTTAAIVRDVEPQRPGPSLGEIAFFPALILIGLTVWSMLP